MHTTAVQLCQCWSHCSSDESKTNSPKKEIFRLKKNWIFLTFLTSLSIISNTTIFYSFHQFITNPREESINRSLSGMEKLEAGLGMSEQFYSWAISVFNIGAVVGALLNGFLSTFVPYWYLILSSLVLHTLGYVLYAVATTGWHIILSKFLSGLFIGAQMTLTYAYISESNAKYQSAIIELGEDHEKAIRVKHRFFALQNLGSNMGNILGPGVAVIFAQFPISQFTSIAWFSAGIGVAIIFIQILIFKGEMKCQTNIRHVSICSCKKIKQIPLPKIISASKLLFLTILIFLIISRSLSNLYFCVNETLLNPILSDSFGFTERAASYFFFALMTARVTGTISLLICQQFHLSNRLISVIGLIGSIIAYTLLGDWQALRPDPCTENSLFHHPELQHQYLSKLTKQQSIIPKSTLVAEGIPCEKLNESLAKYYLTGTDIYVLPSIKETYLYSNCELIHSCSDCVDQDFNRINSMCSNCPHLKLDLTNECFNRNHPQIKDAEVFQKSFIYFCSMYKSQLNVFVLVSTVSPSTQYISLEEYVAHVHIQTVQVIEGRLAALAEQICENQPHYSCHWNPQSEVTGIYCENCPPICRDKTNYLSFSQFLIGAFLLLFWAQMLSVPIIGIITDLVDKKSQGIVIGVVQSSCAMVRSIGPIVLDALYEVVQKRTFLPMLLCICCCFLILVGTLILYPKFDTQTNIKTTTNYDVPKK